MPALLHFVLLFLPFPLLLLLLPLLLISHHRTQIRRRKSKRTSHTHTPPPSSPFPVDMILVLGGDRHREVTALRLYRHKKIVSTLLPLSLDKEGEEEQEIFINYTRTPLILSSGALGKEDLLRMVVEEQEEEEEQEEIITTSIPLEKLTQRTHIHAHTHTLLTTTTTTTATTSSSSSSASWHSHVHFDRSAVCTLSNFTSLLSHFMEKKVRNLLIVTSSSHLFRALCVGRVVCASVGIEVRGLGIADVVDGDTCIHTHTHILGAAEREEEIDARTHIQREGTTVASESFWRCYRDVVRACVWVCTGKDFRCLVCWAHPSRRPE